MPLAIGPCVLDIPGICTLLSVAQWEICPSKCIPFTHALNFKLYKLPEPRMPLKDRQGILLSNLAHSGYGRRHCLIHA